MKTGAADLRRIRKQPADRPKLAIENKANEERNGSFLPPPLKRGKQMLPKRRAGIVLCHGAVGKPRRCVTTLTAANFRNSVDSRS